MLHTVEKATSAKEKYFEKLINGFCVLVSEASHKIEEMEIIINPTRCCVS
jgi:hypothetical protein